MKKTLVILAGLFILLVGAQTVIAEDQDYGLGKTAGVAKLSTTGSVSGITGNVIGAILTMVGVLFLVLMIYGGIIWMLARGNEQQSKKALDTIIAAVLGLIIVLGSYAITNFVFNSFQGKSDMSSCQNKTPRDPSCENNPTLGNCSSFGDSTTCPTTTCCDWRQ